MNGTEASKESYFQEIPGTVMFKKPCKITQGLVPYKFFPFSDKIRKIDMSTICHNSGNLCINIHGIKNINAPN